MRPKKVESPQNPAVRDALRLRDKRPGHGPEAFLVEGPNLVEAVLREARRPGGRAGLARAFYTERFGSKEPGLVRELSRSGAELFEASEQVLKKLSETEAPQGLVAVASYRPNLLVELAFVGVTVVLDGIQDPGNVGTIIRTADAAGASALVLLPGTCDPFMPKALRASAGSVFNLPVVQAGAGELVKRLRDGGIKILASAPRAETSVFDADLTGDLAVVLGNESRGVGKEILKDADFAVSVPIVGGAESLNVTASAAVLLYEALRQRAVAVARSGDLPSASCS